MNDLLKPALKRRMKWSFVGGRGQIDGKTGGVMILFHVGIRIYNRIITWQKNRRQIQIKRMNFSSLYSCFHSVFKCNHTTSKRNIKCRFCCRSRADQWKTLLKRKAPRGPPTSQQARGAFGFSEEEIGVRCQREETVGPHMALPLPSESHPTSI